MSCCGQKRKAYTAAARQAAEIPVIPKAEAPKEAPARFRNTGPVPVSVYGKERKRLYIFPAPYTEVVADAEDAPLLAVHPALVRVG